MSGSAAVSAAPGARGTLALHEISNEQREEEALKLEWKNTVMIGILTVQLVWAGRLPAFPQAQQPATPTPPQASPPAAAQAAPAAPATPAQEASPEVPIALHLENADLLQVVGIIAAELRMNYVVDPTVKGTVFINTLGQLRRADLFPLLQMILRINGATAVQTGNFFRIVPLRDVQRMPIEPMLSPAAGSLSEDDRMVMNIIPL